MIVYKKFLLLMNGRPISNPYFKLCLPMCMVFIVQPQLLAHGGSSYLTNDWRQQWLN